MIFFSVLLALIAEQMRALPLNNRVVRLLQRQITAVERLFIAQPSAYLLSTNNMAVPRWRSMLAWCAVVLPWTVGVGFVYVLLHRVHFIFAYAWSAAVVYFTLGFKQFSAPFTAIHLALRQDDLPQARTLLREWIGLDTTDMSLEEVLRHTMANGMLAVQRRVFGVLFWLIIPILTPFGPVGVVLYRIAEYLVHERNGVSVLCNRAFESFCRKVFFVLNWIPARFTACTFALVGNFEQALYAWRNLAIYGLDSNEDVVLAAAGGALGVRFTDDIAVMEVEGAIETQQAQTSMALTPYVLELGTSLVWRGVILWMALLVMLRFAAWL